MNRIVAPWIAVAVFAAALATGWFHLHKERMLLRRDRAVAERALAARNEIVRQRDALRAIRDPWTTNGGSQAAAGASQVEALRRARDAAALQLHNLRARNAALLGREAAPVWADGAAVKRPDEWSYRGGQTPESALETLLWAAHQGDTARLAETLAFGEKLRPEVADWFGLLPSAVQQELGSAENAVATLVAGAAAFDYRAAAWHQVPDPGSSPDAARVQIRILGQDEQQRDLTFQLGHTAAGWKVLVPEPVFASLRKNLLR